MTKLVLTIIDKSGGEGLPPLGIAYMASYLRKYYNFNSTVIVDKEPNQLKAIIDQRPDIVGISSTTDAFMDAIELATKIKETLDIPVLIGGHHMGLLPHKMPKIFDVGVVGEGEETILELIKSYEKYGGFDAKWLKDVKGIVYKDKEKIIVNELRPLIQNIDTIPYPARDLFKMEEFYLKPRRIYSSVKLARGTHMFTSRGCPFNCVFCSSAQFWRRKTRLHSADYVLGELKELVEKYKVEGLYITDDLFAMDKNRLKEISDGIKREGYDLRFKIATRVDHIDPERVKYFKQMGIDTACLGIESGSQRVLDYLKRGTIKVEQSKKAIQMLKANGINIHGYFMIGAPGETKEDMMKTINFIKENPISSINICAVTPFPGTELWENAKQRGLVSDDMDWRKLEPHPAGKNFIMVNDQMTKEEFLGMYRLVEKVTDEMMHSLDFKAKHLLSANVWKRAIKNPKEAWKYLYYGTKKKLKHAD